GDRAKVERGLEDTRPDQGRVREVRRDSDAHAQETRGGDEHDRRSTRQVDDDRAAAEGCRNAARAGRPAALRRCRRTVLAPCAARRKIADIVFDAIRKWRERRVLRTAAIPDGLWREAANAQPFLAIYSEDELARLRQKVILFLSSKSIFGVRGHEVTP